VTLTAALITSNLARVRQRPRKVPRP
jgi:hypothetical protein